MCVDGVTCDWCAGVVCPRCARVQCAVSWRRLSEVNWVNYPRVPSSQRPSLLIPASLSWCCGVAEPRLLLANCCCDPQHSDLRISVECHLPDPWQGPGTSIVVTWKNPQVTSELHINIFAKKNIFIIPSRKGSMVNRIWSLPLCELFLFGRKWRLYFEIFCKLNCRLVIMLTTGLNSCHAATTC